jgi:hypothetical protein
LHPFWQAAHIGDTAGQHNQEAEQQAKPIGAVGQEMFLIRQNTAHI